jgi:hypothetical protein
MLSVETNRLNVPTADMNIVDTPASAGIDMGAFEEKRVSLLEIVRDNCAKIGKVFQLISNLNGSKIYCIGLL